MKKILVLGAGLSATSLISYLLEQCAEHQWKLIVGDLDINLARSKIAGHSCGTSITFDVFDDEQRRLLISSSDIVISMLPAHMHYLVAESCIEQRKAMVTASYASREMENLDAEATRQGVLLLNELGVDPGIDHMSAMRIIDRISRENGRLDVFESNTGGLVAPGFDDNPWRYKFTWNPRNVVLAGQKGARFLHNGKFKYIPYHKLFSRYEVISVLDLGDFEVYPNRDSLQYKDVYGLDEVSTMFRGTIRRPGFCDAWDLLVQLGATDDSYIVEFPGRQMTYRDFTNSFLAYNITDPVETKLAHYLGIPRDSVLMEKLKWLGLFEAKKIGRKNLTPAGILQQLLEEKWRFGTNDKDMIVMQHQFEYTLARRRYRIVSSMYLIGSGDGATAMAQTVGLPVAFAAELILKGKIISRGVRRPVTPEFYEPILEKLAQHGIRFIDEEYLMQEY